MKKVFVSLFVLLLVAASVYVWTFAPIITGYAAQSVCAGIFVSDRGVASIEW